MLAKDKERLRKLARNRDRVKYCKIFLVKKEMTQRDLANKYEMTDNKVCDYIHGRNNNRKLAKFFELNEKDKLI